MPSSPSSTSQGTQTNLRIHTIYVYPIKSLRGCKVSSLKATTTGFDYDRRYMLIRRSDGRNMHVSEFTEMCLFTTELVLHSTSTSSTQLENGRTERVGTNSDKNDNNDSSNLDTDAVMVRYTLDHVFDQPDSKINIDEVLQVPLNPDVETLGLKHVNVTMHSSSTTGFAMGDSYDEWFSKRLGYDVLLLYVGDNRRKVLGNVTPYHPIHQIPQPQQQKQQQKDTKSSSSSSAPRSDASSKPTDWFGGVSSIANTIYNGVFGEAKDDSNGYDGTRDHNDKSNDFEGIDTGIGFADCAPFLIVNTKSWENASNRLPEGIEMDISKFRPNIIIEGAQEAFEEDFWAELQFTANDTRPSIGEKEESLSSSIEQQQEGIRMVLTANCARCNSLNVDYNTGKVGQGEDGKILKKLQKDRRVDLGTKYSPVFGRYGFLAEKKHSISTSMSDTHTHTHTDTGTNGHTKPKPIKTTFSVGDQVIVTRRNSERMRFYWPSLSTDK